MGQGIATILWNKRQGKYFDSDAKRRSSVLKTALLRQAFSQAFSTGPSRVWLVADEPGIVVRPPADAPFASHEYYYRPGSFLSGFFALQTEDIEGTIKHVTGSPQLKFGGDIELRYLDGIENQRLGVIALCWNDPNFHTDARHGDVKQVIEEYNVWARELLKQGLLIDAQKLEFTNSRFKSGGQLVEEIFRGEAHQLAGILTTEADEKALMEKLESDDLMKSAGALEVRDRNAACSCG